MQCDITIRLTQEAMEFSVYADPINGLVLLTRRLGNGQIQIVGTRDQLRDFSDHVRACIPPSEVIAVNEEAPVV